MYKKAGNQKFPVRFVEKVFIFVNRTNSLSPSPKPLWTLCGASSWCALGVHFQASLPLCERSVAHCHNALWAFTFRHPCLPSPMGKEGSKAKLLKISRKADRDAPCDQARMLDSVRTEVLHDAKPTNERRLALGLRLKQGCFSCLPRVLQGCKTN